MDWMTYMLMQKQAQGANRAPAEAPPNPDVMGFKSDVNKNTSGNSQDTREGQILGADKYNQLVNRLNTYGVNDLAVQKQGVDANLESLARLNSVPNQLDLSSAASFIDNTGNKDTHYAKDYKAPPSVRDNQELYMKLSDAVQKERQGMSKSQIDLLKTQIQGYQDMKLQQALMGTATASNYNPHPDKASTPRPRLLPAGTLTGLADGQSVIGLVQDLGQSIKNSHDIMGPVIGNGAKSPFSFGSDTIEKQQALQAKIQLIDQKIGKLLEGGVLRKEDELKYKRMLPKVNERPELGEEKVGNLIDTLKRDLGNKVQTYGDGGYDTSGLNGIRAAAVRTQGGSGAQAQAPAQDLHAIDSQISEIGDILKKARSGK